MPTRKRKKKAYTVRESGTVFVNGCDGVDMCTHAAKRKWSASTHHEAVNVSSTTTTTDASTAGLDVAADVIFAATEIMGTQTNKCSPSLQRLLAEFQQQQQQQQQQQHSTEVKHAASQPQHALQATCASISFRVTGPLPQTKPKLERVNMMLQDMHLDVRGVRSSCVPHQPSAQAGTIADSTGPFGNVGTLEAMSAMNSMEVQLRLATSMVAGSGSGGHRHQGQHERHLVLPENDANEFNKNANEFSGLIDSDTQACPTYEQLEPTMFSPSLFAPPACEPLALPRVTSLANASSPNRTASVQQLRRPAPAVARQIMRATNWTPWGRN